MPTIQQLPASVINKIAAGEVIERPASVVKELVENSVDAGAHRIDVQVTKGGTDLIQVSDDGCGISADQLELAIASHATSKLQDADDLFQVATLGFRGEALASIAEVSQFRIRSRTDANAAGAELEIHGGQYGQVAPCGCPIGTSIAVRNLFCNTPVRRKFLRTVQTEMGHVSDSLIRIALPHAKTHFTLTHNAREIYDLPAVEDWRSRIGSLFGRELTDSLMEVSADEGDVHMHGFVADPSQNRANNRMQFLFLNGRHIRDRALGHALGEAYRGLLMTGRYPIAFLCLEMPPEMVDVNVHPKKLEVRFQDGGRLYSQLLGMLRSRFLSSDLTAHAKLSQGSSEGPIPSPIPPPLPSPIPSPGGGARDRVNQWAESQTFKKFPDGNATLATPRQIALDLEFSGPGSRRAASPDFPSSLLSRPDVGHLANTPPVDEVRGGSYGESSRRHSPADSPGHSTENIPPWDDQQPPPHMTANQAVSAEGTPAMQVYDRYLITETDEGVVVIDQHALHERILYEEIRAKVLSGDVEMQRLLVPEPVQLTSAEAAVVLDNRETLKQLGMEVEPFGNDTILVSAYPAMLANLNPAEILRQTAEKLMTPEKQVDRRDVLDELLHMISCKAAIKAGDRLTCEEINALLERRQVVQDAHHCPHGRPTTLIFTRDELDRRFKRI